MEPCASSYRHVGIRRPKLSLVRFEFQLVQLPLCSLVSFQAFQVHIANGQRPDVTSVILLGNRQPGPLQSTNSAHHWSCRSISGHPHLSRTGERHLRRPSWSVQNLWREKLSSQTTPNHLASQTIPNHLGESSKLQYHKQTTCEASPKDGVRTAS